MLLMCRYASYSACFSIEYWFRCMDLDGDGIISMYEMEYFYDEQLDKMEALGIEKLPFEDCLCQVCFLYSTCFFLLTFLTMSYQYFTSFLFGMFYVFHVLSGLLSLVVCCL